MNKMLDYMVRKDLAEFIKDDTDCEIYEIGSRWITVNAETDVFNQKVLAKGMNEKDENGEYKEWEWGIYKAHFTKVASFDVVLKRKKRFDRESKSRKYTVHFQLVHQRFVGTILEHKDTNVLRCIVCEEQPNGGEDEILNTDFDCWDDVQSFLED